MGGKHWRRAAVVTACVVLAGTASQSVASAQTYIDARRMAMGGLFMKWDDISRYNVAYRAVPQTGDEARTTIPIPIGLLQLASDAPELDPQDSTFNAFEILDLILNPPLYLELREATIPESDVEVTLGKNFLQIDLGAAQDYIPDDGFSMGSSSRPLDFGGGVAGFRFGVSGFVQNELDVGLSDNLRAFLKEAAPAETNTRYFITGDGVAQTGFAIGGSYSRRALSLEALGFGAGRGPEDGVYVGGGLRYYFGAAFATVGAETGFTTGDSIFGSADTLQTDLTADIIRSDVNGLGDTGRGVGMDLGVAFVSGPLTVGFGINDLFATLTWNNTIAERHTLDADSNRIVTRTIASGAETKTELPVSYLLSGSLKIGWTEVGADILHTSGGVSVHVGAEQWFGPLAARGGLARDNRGKIQFGLGGGVRVGAVSLDVGLMTHSQSFSGERGVRLGTSVSIY